MCLKNDTSVKQNNADQNDLQYTNLKTKKDLMKINIANSKIGNIIKLTNKLG